MSNIGIVGTGVAGLHLGLMLQQHGVSVTLYTDRTAEQVASGRLLNTVMHHYGTRERERALGVADWPLAECGWWTRYHSVLGDPGIDYRGNFDEASLAIDYRLYLPHLQTEFANRGGKVEIARFDLADLERVSLQHDLIVVAAGRGPLAEMFGRREDLSPYDSPQRVCVAGLFEGVDRPAVEGVSINVSRGVGELIEFPMLTAGGKITALLFESIPGGDLDALARQNYQEDPSAFDALILNAVQTHYPRVGERVRTSDFGLLGANDLLQGGVTPVVRNDYVQLESGRFALALGDCHTAVDPLMGQGANAASFSAFVTGEAILTDSAFDESFCRRLASQRAGLVHAASLVTNMYLEFPPHLKTLQAASLRNQRVADAVAAAFARPDKMWRIMATPERVDAFVSAIEGE